MWTFIDNGTDKVPSGLICECGEKMSHYSICEECGGTKFEAIDIHIKEEHDD